MHVNFNLTIEDIHDSAAEYFTSFERIFPRPVLVLFYTVCNILLSSRESLKKLY
jgi:hypothetical protein